MTTHVDTVRLDDGRVVTTSYGVPVAVFIPAGCFLPNGNGGGLSAEGHFKSDRTYSSTSSRHANLYARQNGQDQATVVPHSVFVNLVKPLACPV